MRKKILYVPFIQGVYFLATLVWPVIAIESFMAVTGSKVDIWLVKTVSALLLPYTVICFWTAFNARINFIVVLTMVLACWGLAIVELYYYLNEVIRWVYGVDALLQILFSFWWIRLWTKLKINNYEKENKK